ncbi:DUF5677 domain-containing protein, partial [Chloroflexota bacterium]
MPTEPDKNIFDPEPFIEIVKPAIELASQTIREAFNYGTNLYNKCRLTSKADVDEAYPVLAIYLHVLQMIDSAEILISNICIEPSKLLIRSAFEAKLGLEFMNEKMTRTRGIAWIIRNILDRIEVGERHTKDHAKGKDFFETLKREGFEGFVNISPMKPEITKEYIENLKNSLEKPGYADIYQEYKRLEKNRRRVEWYSLYDGPASIRDLAEYLKQLSMYDSLYRSWSKQTHAASADHLTMIMKDGQTVLGPIRYPMNIAHVANFALGILLQSDIVMINRFLSGDLKKFSQWYRTEIWQKQLALYQGEMEHLKWFENTF